MWLSHQLVADVSNEIDEVFYLSFQQTRVYNERRKPGEPMVFSGWYWAKGRQEAGPFRSQSSAYRDAFYRLVRKQAPPRLHNRNGNIVQLPRRKAA